MKKQILLLMMLSMASSLVNAQKKVNLVLSPDPIVVEVGKTLALEIVATDDSGNKLEETKYSFFPVQLKGIQQNMIFTGGIEVDSLGVISATQVGLFDLFVSRVPGEGEAFASGFYKVNVVNQPVAKIDFKNHSNVYAGVTFPLEVAVLDKGNNVVMDGDLIITSSNPEIISVDKTFSARALKKGKVTLSAKSGDITTEIELEVLANPVASIELESTHQIARTGDVVYFKSTTYDKSGNELEDMPISYYVSGKADEFGYGASAQINNMGSFVAETPGIYTVSATSGNNVTTKNIEIGYRNVSRKITMKGQGSVTDKHTSDFWVWEGVDGKDYAVTGTWGSNGTAYFWEVTNVENIVLIDSIQVDARTVNDVKVSEDGKVCVISREGASNRKNGIVILDVTNPREVEILSTYTENLTGGVHNVFIDKGYVYALSNSQWYEIIDIKDPVNPKGVSKFELPNSKKSIHDVWIEDGIAYSSNWSDGIAMVDVGNGIAGGSPENPVEIARAHVQGDANHAAFPYKSKETGKFYVIAGDEIFPLAAMYSQNLEEIFIPDGYLHFMDLTDPENPMEVARYQLPEAGSHNFWVKDDLLYIGYYNGGLRIVDISGDLMGDLYKQGREVAHFLSFDKNGFIPNSPFVWGAQPYKGHVFFSDFNSGLWSAQLEPISPEESIVEAK